MGVVWLWARATTRRALGGLLLIAVLAGLSGATVLIAVVGAERTRSALDRAVVADDPAVINLNSNDAHAFDGLDQIPGVREVLPFETFIGGTAGKGLLLQMSPRPFGVDVDRIRPARGQLPDKPDEVMLTEQAAAAQHLHVGDTLTFESMSPAQFDDPDAPGGPTVALRVVGIGSSLIQKVQPDDAAGWVSEQFAKKFDSQIAHIGGLGDVPTIVFVWVNGGERAINAVQEAMAKVGPNVGFSRFSTFATPAKASTDIMATGVLVFALAAAVAGAGAVAIAVARHLARFRNDQSPLQALGVSRRHRALLGVVSVTPAAALAGLIAVVAVVAASRVMPFGASARRLDPDVGSRPSVWVLVTTGLAVLSFVSGAAFVATWAHAARRGMRPAGLVSRMVSGPFGRWPLVTTGVGFAIGGRSANQPGAVRAALAAGVLGVAGVAGGVSVVGALDALHHTPERWGYTWSVTIDEGFDDDSAAAAADARDLFGRPELEAAAAAWAVTSDAPARINGIDVRADAIEPGSGTIAPAMGRGRSPASPNDVVLSTSFAQDLHVSIGDTVTASTDAGSVPLTVVGVATLYPVDSRLLRSPAVLMTTAGRDNVARDRAFYRLAIRAAPGLSADDLYTRMKAVLGDGMPEPSTALADAPSEVRNAEQLRGVALALALFMGALGVVVVTNAVFATPRRRGRDLAVLRALGIGRAQTAAMIGVQAASISLIAVVVGVPLGAIGAHQAFTHIADRAGVGPGPTTTWTVLTLVTGGVILLAPLIAAWPAWRAARARPTSALHRE
jgi:FtsX-like permease family